MSAARTPERNWEIIETMLSDDDLIDIATTCSNRGMALAAEIHLRKRAAAPQSGEAEGK